MKNETKISWANKTWNPLVGCALDSPGCTNCYAMKVAYREAEKGVAKFNDLTVLASDNPVWNGNVRVAKERVLNDPGRWKEPTMIFVNSMSDLFYEAFDERIIFDLLDRMVKWDWHIFMVLTKREARMRDMVDAFCESRGLETLPRHIWMGVSVEDNKRAARRIPPLAETRAETRFVSMEPLLESVDLSGFPVLDWYIVGGESVELGESPKKARPFDVSWALAIAEYCKSVGAAFHFKQFGSNPVGVTLKAFKGDSPEEFPESVLIREYPY